MVQAIQKGIKKQTRRVINIQPPKSFKNPQLRFIDFSTTKKDTGKWVWCDVDSKSRKSYDTMRFNCPYGRVGDWLWVRETFCPLYVNPEKPEEEPYPLVAYKNDQIFDTIPGLKWKSPIYMPKKFHRTLLEITEIRAERLKNISTDDIRREGCSEVLYPFEKSCFLWWEQAWRSINGSESWEENPWVWVITFDLIYWWWKPSAV